MKITGVTAGSAAPPMNIPDEYFCRARSVCSSLLPFGLSDCGLMKNLTNQWPTDHAHMRVRDVDLQSSLLHELMSSPRKWPDKP